MCDPFTIGGLVLSAASVAANSVASSEVQDAREQSIQAERARQAALDKQADALNATSRNRYQDFSGKQDDRAAQLGTQLSKNMVAPTPSSALMPQSSSNIVNTETGKQTGAATTYAGGQASALGNLRAFGDLLGEDSRLQGQDASQVAQIGDFKRGSSAVLQDELQADNQAGAGMGFLGDLLGGAGGLVSKGSSGPAGSLLNGIFGSKGVATTAPNFGYTSALPTTTTGTPGSAFNGTGGLY